MNWSTLRSTTLVVSATEKNGLWLLSLVSCFIFSDLIYGPRGRRPSDCVHVSVDVRSNPDRISFLLLAHACVCMHVNIPIQMDRQDRYKRQYLVLTWAFYKWWNASAQIIGEPR